jgi:hypothetical protein
LVNFPFTFTNIPIVTATPVYTGVDYMLSVIVTVTTTTGFKYNVFSSTGGSSPAHIEKYVSVNWIAIAA